MKEKPMNVFTVVVFDNDGIVDYRTFGEREHSDAVAYAEKAQRGREHWYARILPGSISNGWGG